MVRLRYGDISALEALVRLHQTPALRLAYSITGSRETAEDVVMDAFVAVVTHIEQFDRSLPFAPWFRRIVVNGALAAVRTSRRRALIWNRIGRSQPNQVSVSEVAETHDLRDRLEQAFATLTPDERAVAALRLAFGMSEKEVAASLGCRIGTVKSRLARARRKLRQRLTNRAVFATALPSHEET